MQFLRHRRFSAEWAVLLAVQFLVVAVLATVLAREHRDVRAAEVKRLSGQVRVIDDNLSGQIDAADKALSSVAAQIGRAGAPEDKARVAALLRILADALPATTSMFWLDRDGTVVASALDQNIGKNFAQRDYFTEPRRVGDVNRLYVSPPFHSTLGNYRIVMSRMLVDAEGRFAGVVTASLDPEYAGLLLRSVLYADDMRAALVYRNGTVYLDLPETAAPKRDAAGLAALVTANPRSAGGPSEGVDSIALGGSARLAGIRRIDAKAPMHEQPLFAVVSRDRSTVLAPWRAQAWEAGGLVSFLVLVSSIALWLDQRRRREAILAADAAARERRVAAERIEQALQGADLGLWELHVPSHTFLINARERALLGYGVDDPLPQGPAWKELIHPDDRAHVDAAIVPHLRGQASAYDCEHRMRHRDGHFVWLFSRAMIVERDAKGAPLRIVGTHLDITERKQAEEELQHSTASLRDSEAQLRLLTDNMPALVSRLDLAQRFRFANRAYLDWLSTDPQSLIGRSLLEVYGATAYQGFEQHVTRALAGTRVTYERDLATPAGTRRVEFTLVPESDADGKVTGLYTLATDLTARHEAERRLARSEERLSIALEGAGQALFDWNLASATVYQSAEATVLRGLPPAAGESSVEEVQRHVHPEDRPGLRQSARDAVTGKRPLYLAEFRLQHRSGHWIWIRAHGRVVQRDPTGRALRITGTYSDVSERKSEEGRLRRLAEFDTLTGVPNRALFHDRLRQAMARAARGKPMALLFLDIDHFKDINDTLGHESGDEVLKVFAHRMQSVVRTSDTVARLGGDEFTIILEAIRGAADASAIADKLNRVLQAPIVLADGDLQVTASIGVALCIPGESDEAALIRRADAALYEAKRRGRNSHFCAEMGTETTR